MDYRKSNAPSNTVTRDMMKLSADTGNVYETVMKGVVCQRTLLIR